MQRSHDAAVAVAFPSEGFFQALAERMNSQTDKYRRYGGTDLRLGIRIEEDGPLTQDRFFGLVFADYWCDEAREYPGPEAFRPECTVTGPYRAWKEMFQNIQAHGMADDKHTLNCLVHLDDPFRIEAQDQFEADKLYRYMFSIQLFLEEAAGLNVEYAG